MTAGQVVGCGAVAAHAGEPDTGGQPYGEIKRMVVDAGARVARASRARC